MSVANAQGFEQNEYILIKKVTPTSISQEVIQIVSSSIENSNTGAGSIMVTRAVSSSASTYEDGQTLVSTGKINTGYIKINANPNDISTPYIDIVERTGSNYEDFELKARLGDLSGLNSSLVGSSPGYGLYSENVFLTGRITSQEGAIGG